MNETILTITGSDSTGESGVQADIQTITALGGRALTALTSITVQTTLGIQEFFDVPAHIVAGQVEAIFNDVQPQVVKVGLIRTKGVLDAVVSALEKFRPQHVIYDPTVLSARGDALVSDEVVLEIRRRLLPLCTLVVQLDQSDMHGLANRYASAVAVFLSKGASPEDAQAQAKTYINTQILRSEGLRGRSPELYHELLDAVRHSCYTNSDVHFYANKLNVSARYLAQVTKRICGKTPKMIIDEILIEEIERQLTTTEKTIQEIAYEFGFSSQAHFTKYFKKQKGIPPTKFRKQ